VSKPLLLILVVLLCGCGTFKKGAEVQFAKEVKKVLEDELPDRFTTNLKSDNSKEIIQKEALKILDAEIPPDNRASLRNFFKWFGEALAALGLGIAAYFRTRFNLEKKRNGVERKN